MSKQIRILILDDNEVDAELMERALRKAKLSYLTRRVATKADFLAALDSFAPDVVLSEYEMPGISGLEALQLMQERQSEAPFILVTDLSSEEQAIEWMKLGVSDYVLKESLRRVPAAVLNSLEKRESERARRQAFEALRESQHFVQRIADSTPNILYIYDLVERRIVYCNRQLTTTLGYSTQKIQQIGSLFELKIIHPDDYAQVRQRNRRFGRLPDGEVVESEYRIRHANGEWRWLNSRETVFTRAPDHAPQQILGTAQDITERKQAEERIIHLSYHDPLTGLPNRVLFSDRLSQALTLSAEGSKQITALLLLDLDRFKTINDTLGETVGDRLLKELANRLTDCVRDGDTVARFGSDEFAVLLTQIKRTEDAVKLAQSVHDALQAVFVLKEHELFATASIGISLAPFDGTDAQSLLKNAGAALYRAKEQGGNNFQFYTSDMTARAIKRLELENNIRRGLEREQFMIHYQPQVDLETGHIVGMEALVRWQHPELGLISPGEFIPLAEDTGLIMPLGEWVLRSACAQYRRWQECGLSPLLMSVNVSARQFQQSDLVRMVSRVLRETELEPRFLELELTESAVMKDPERAISTLRQLKEMGIKISIDDFGTGYSSLSYLKRFPIDVLKIDRSFVRDITTDPDDEAIVMAIIELAHNLNLRVIAEGVETEAQLGFLRLLKCNAMQGYLFSKPLASLNFEQMLVKGQYLGATRETAWEWWRLGDYAAKYRGV